MIIKWIQFEGSNGP